MAKKKVNTKFLIILTVVVAGGGGGLVVSQKVISRLSNRPEKFVKLADDYMAQGEYEKAAGNYAKAFGLGGQRDLDLMMKQGEAWKKLADAEPVYSGRMVACWTKTLEINHTYAPALEKLVDYWDEWTKTTPNPESRARALTQLKDYAARLHEAEPSNKGAAAKVPMTVVRGWLFGIATDPKELDGALAELAKLEPQDPGNAEIPLVLAQADLKRADEAGRRQDTAGARRLLKHAGELFDAAVKGQDKNVEMYARAAMVYSALAHSRGLGEADQKEYAGRAKGAIARVQAAANPADEKQSDELVAVGRLMAQDDPAGAEKALADLVKARPDNVSARLAYAHVVAQGGDREKAIEVLSAPVPQGGNAGRVRYDDALRLYELCGLQLEQYSDVKDPAGRDALVKQVEANLAKLQELQSGTETPGLLRLRGQLLMMKGQQTEAVQTLARARQMMQQQGGTDDQLTSALAMAYLMIGQTGEAKTLMTQVLVRHPDFVPARRTLAQLFLQENDADDAEPHVQYLEKAQPKDADVIRMRMAILMLRKQPAEAKKLYDGLPEGDRRAKLVKAQAGLAIGNNDDAARLLEDVRKEDPKNVGVVRMLVAAHKARNDMASARRVVDEAIVADPQNLMLVGMRKALAGATGQEMEKFSREVAEKNPDPFARELQLAGISADEDKGAEALEHLRKAEQIKPEDPRVLDLLFQAYARDGKWDLAGQYVDRLTKINADKMGGMQYRFRLLMAQGKFADGLALAQDLSGKMPEFSQTWVTLAQAQQANGHLDQAVSAYLRALEKQSDSADAMRGLIDCYYQQNKPDDALRYIAQARRTFPTSPYFQELELRHSLRFGDPAQAVAQWEDARKRNPEARSTWANLAQAYWRALTVQKDPAGQKKYADALAGLAEDGIKKWPDERLFYAYLADLAAVRGDMAGGVDALRRLAAVPAWKDKPEPAMLLTDYYARFGKFAEAEASAREALAKAGAGNVAAVRRLAGVQAQAGKVDEAIQTLDGVKSDDAGVARQKLQLLVAARRLDSAEKLAVSLLEKDPKAGDVVNTLVGIYLEGGRYDQAMTRVQQVLAVDPGNLQALYSRGLVYLKQAKPDVDAAVKDFKAVRDKDERNVEARYWLSEALLAKGDKDGAIRELEAAVRSQPANKLLRLRMVQVCSSATPPRWVDAERILTEGRKLPELSADPDLAVAEARMWIARQQADRAVEVARQAMGQARGNPEVIRAYADALLASGNYQRLIDETQALVAKPETTPWWVYQDRAVADRRLGKKDEALAEFERALNTKEVQARDDLGAAVLNKLAEEMGVDEALAQVKSKAETSPRWQLVQAYLYQQKHDSAAMIATVDRLMAGVDKLSADERLSVLRFAGTAYLSAQPKPMADKALDAFQRSLKESPDDPAILNNIASLLTDFVEPARPQEALKYSQHAYDLMMKSGRIEPLVLDTQGRVLTMVNRVEEGIVLLQDAADRTTIPDVHYHLAEAYMMKQAPEEAQKHLAQASAAIEKAKKDLQPVDPKMVQRIAELGEQAKKMIASKAQAGAR
jgi:predicted Zn-dependent protease